MLSVSLVLLSLLPSLHVGGTVGVLLHPE